jgi:hypothetical protein
MGLGASGHGTKVRQPSGAKGGSIDLDVDTVTRTVTAVTLTSGARPVTATFAKAVGSHVINHPANTTTTYNVSAQNIPVTEHAITKEVGTKYVLRPSYMVQW